MNNVETDIVKQELHVPHNIMQEVYQIEPNPRPATLLLFLEHNYPQYTEKDAAYIWENAQKNVLFITVDNKEIRYVRS